MTKTERQSVAHGADSNPATCWTKRRTICRGIHVIFQDISKFVFIYCTISDRGRNNVLRKREWETLFK